MGSSNHITGVRIPAHARVYLTFDVIDKEYGQKDNACIMAKLDLHDMLDIRITRRKSGKCVNAPKEIDHLGLWKAAASQFAMGYGLDGEVNIQVNRQVPHGWDLGEEESIAAAVLRALAILHQVPQNESFHELSRGLHPQVEFFVQDHDMIGSAGYGKPMVPMNNVPPIEVVLANPRVDHPPYLARRGVYNLVTSARASSWAEDKEQENAPHALAESSIGQSISSSHAIVPRHALQIEDVVAVMRRYDGCRGAAILGPGRGVIGFYTNSAAANNAAMDLRIKNYDTEVTRIKRPR